MSPLTIPAPLLLSTLANEGGGNGHAANAATELILVFLLLLVFWGLFRITSKKRS